MDQITHDMTSEGFVFFRGPAKLAVVTCLNDSGKKETRFGIDGKPIIDKEGHVVLFTVLEPMARKDWTIHFTSPALKVEEVEAIVAAMPKENYATHNSERVAK